MTRLIRELSKRSYKEDDYSILAKWCKAWGYKTIPKAFLSSKGTIIEVEKAPAVMGWLFETDSKMCMIRWVISDKEIHKVDRHRAVDALLESFHADCEALGFKYIFVPADGNNAQWNQRLKDHNWIHTDKNVNLYMRRI